MAAPKQEKQPMVAFTLDFETGGLNCQTSACTQIAIHATRLDTFEHLGSFVRYIAPYTRKKIKGVGTEERKVLKTKYDKESEPMMEYDQKALTYSDISMELLETKGVDIVQVANEALQFIIDHTPKGGRNAKPFLIGQNVEFDKGFFMQMMEYAGLKTEISKVLRGHVDFYGHWQPDVLDTLIIGQLALCHLPEVNSYKLEIMCENLGIELEDAHDADADVAATTNVLAVCTRRMRSLSENGDDGGIELTKTEKTRKHFKI